MSKSKNRKKDELNFPRGEYRSKWSMVHEDKRKRNKHKQNWRDELEEYKEELEIDEEEE